MFGIGCSCLNIYWTAKLSLTKFIFCYFLLEANEKQLSFFLTGIKFGLMKVNRLNYPLRRVWTYQRVIRRRNSKTNRQCNCQRKKYKESNNNLQVLLQTLYKVMNGETVWLWLPKTDHVYDRCSNFESIFFNSDFIMQNCL